MWFDWSTMEASLSEGSSIDDGSLWVPAWRIGSFVLTSNVACTAAVRVTREDICSKNAWIMARFGPPRDTICGRHPFPGRCQAGSTPGEKTGLGKCGRRVALKGMRVSLCNSLTHKTHVFRLFIQKKEQVVYTVPVFYSDSNMSRDSRI